MCVCVFGSHTRSALILFLVIGYKRSAQVPGCRYVCLKELISLISAGLGKDGGMTLPSCAVWLPVFCLCLSPVSAHLSACLSVSVHSGAADTEHCSAFAEVCTRTHCSRSPQNGMALFFSPLYFYLPLLVFSVYRTRPLFEPFLHQNVCLIESYYLLPPPPRE